MNDTNEARDESIKGRKNLNETIALTVNAKADVWQCCCAMRSDVGMSMSLRRGELCALTSAAGFRQFLAQFGYNVAAKPIVLNIDGKNELIR